MARSLSERPGGRWRSGALVVLLGAVGLLGGGCGPRYSTSSPAQAIAATAAVVALTGVNRALTGDCWARCSKGYSCDRASGFCVQTECVPACSDTEQCVARDRDHLTCLPISLAVPSVTRAQPGGPGTPLTLNPPPAAGAPNPNAGPGGSATFPSQR